MFQKRQRGVVCRLLYTILCVMMIYVPFCSAAVIYVDDTATGVNDGSSWIDAYTDLQTALSAAADGNDIWVAQGTYKPTAETDRTASFLMKQGVSMFGGFPDSGEPTMDDRDPAAYETILSGDIGILDDINDNSYHVVKGAADAALDGFVITQGNANGGGLNGYGGGLYIEQQGPTINNCVFIDNHAVEFGGGGFAYNVTSPNLPLFDTCKFIGNTAKSGGLAFYQCNNSIVRNCVFSGNDVVSYGGGMYCYLSNTTVINCSFSGNSADFGGAFNSGQCTPKVSNCIMWGNTAPHNSEILSSANVTYCAVEGGWGDPEDKNMDADPNFMDDDLHISAYSVCINAGDPNTNNAGQHDRDGSPRIRYQRIDMGAYEVFPIEGDLDTDEKVELDDLLLFAADRWMVDADLTDYAIFSRQWLYGASPIPGDLNDDNKVDMDDLLLLVSDDW